MDSIKIIHIKEGKSLLAGALVIRCYAITREVMGCQGLPRLNERLINPPTFNKLLKLVLLY